MTDGHQDAFVREGEERIAELNRALLDLEDDPADEEAMATVFRAAHTLKGNFAALGFTNVSALAHALEDLFDEIRQGDLRVTAGRMDQAFAVVDELKACLDTVAANGECNRDVQPVIEKVQAAARAGFDEDQQKPDNAQATPDPVNLSPLDNPIAEPASRDEVGGREIRDGKSIRVEVSRLEDLDNIVARLVAARHELRRSVGEDQCVAAGLNELDNVTATLQNTLMDIRFVRIETVTGSFPRLIRDLARDTDKRVDFAVEGGEIEIDRAVLTEISGPLVHVLRNAVDHGIEPPKERMAAGKDPIASVILRATRDREQVIFEIVDDGRGLDLDRVRAAAVKAGVGSAQEIEQLDDQAVADLVFHPGLTTADEVTNVSGRGVGLNVVHDVVSRLGGDAHIETTVGEGTTVTLTLPVAGATTEMLFVTAGDEEYGIPTGVIDDVSQMYPSEQVGDKKDSRHNGDIPPLVWITDALNIPHPSTSTDRKGTLLHIQSTDQRFAIQCDGVSGRESVVVNDFEGTDSDIPGLAGAAVRENDLVPILDVDGLSP